MNRKLAHLSQSESEEMAFSVSFVTTLITQIYSKKEKHSTFSINLEGADGPAPQTMGVSPKKYSSDFKVKVALEAIKEQKTINEISSEYGVHSTQITEWKKRVLEELPGIFAHNGSDPRVAQRDF